MSQAELFHFTIKGFYLQEPLTFISDWLISFFCFRFFFSNEKNKTSFKCFISEIFLLFGSIYLARWDFSFVSFLLWRIWTFPILDNLFNINLFFLHRNVAHVLSNSKAISRVGNPFKICYSFVFISVSSSLLICKY